MPEFSNSRRVSNVVFQPMGRRIGISPGETLLTAALSAGVDLVSLCGGVGLCDGCVVRLTNGRLSEPSPKELQALGSAQLAEGYRLACQAMPIGDVELEVPPESSSTPQRLQIEGQEVYVGHDVLIRPIEVTLEPPSVSDLRSDATRLRDAVTLKEKVHLRIGTAVLSELSNRLRVQGWNARLAMQGDRVAAILPPRSRIVGLAVDVGTTKLACYLVDLTSGEMLAKIGRMNPQISYGEDVISRIAYANSRTEGRRTLQSGLIGTLNSMVAEMCRETKIASDTIVEAVIVGNTAMHHLLAGFPVRQLGTAPYVASVSEATDIPARELGLVLAPGALIHLPPNIAGFVGADHVATVLATDVWKSDGAVIAIDIGTNTEITLACAGRLLCCSCASGPAFEGARIRDGMRASEGAIERVRILDNRALVFTIGGKPAVGICGSGILDAIAELVRNGLIDHSGRFQGIAKPYRSGDHVQRDEFVLVPAAMTGHGKNILVTSADVHEIQLAKAAIRAGIETLLACAGIRGESLDGFVIAGAFGTYLDVQSAIQIGMFPNIPRDRFRQVGNAAGAGARRMLVSAESRMEAGEIVQREKYVELTTYPGFEKLFLEALAF